MSDLNDVAFLVTSNGTLRMVAREGSEVTNSNGWVLSSTIPEPTIYFNNRGQFLFPSNVSGDPTGAGASVAWFRAYENGIVRPVTMGLEIVEFEGGDRIRVNSMLPSSPISFNNEGVFVVANQFNPGSMVGGVAVSGPAVIAITITPDQLTSQCAGDFNADHSVTVQDIFDFLTAWFAQDLRADFNADRGVTVQDLFDLLNAWFEGC